MEYKVLIKLYLPEIEQNYELYIPVNKTIGEVKEVLITAVNNITNNLYPMKNNFDLYDRRSNVVYNNDDIVRNTNIRNGSELIMF